MKLWLLKAREDLPLKNDPWEPWYDKVFTMVVRAETEEEARRVGDENAGEENDEERAKQPSREARDVLGRRVAVKPWLDAGLSTCEELRADGEAGLVCQDERMA